MSDVLTEHRTITKLRLAALLGIPPDDLLTRPQAAEMIGISQKSLANLAQREASGSCPMFYCSSTSGTAGTTWYPRAEVEAFAAHRRSSIKSSYLRTQGRQDWTTLERAGGRVELHRISNLIWMWRKSELYFRAEAILNAPDCAAQEASFYQECASFLRAARSEKATTPLSAALVEHRNFDIKAGLDDDDLISAKFLKLVQWREINLDLSHPSFRVMVGMFEAAWSIVLLNEAGWRAMGYAGMPTIPPPTSSRIPI